MVPAEPTDSDPALMTEFSRTNKQSLVIILKAKM